MGKTLKAPEVLTVKITTRRCVETKYLGPTNSHGARIKGTNVTSKKTLTMNWNHELDALDNHAQVAARLLESNDLIDSSVDNGGWMWMSRT